MADREYSSLLQELANGNFTIKTSPKRARRSSQFSEIIKKNADVADQSLALIKKLNKNPDNADEVERLIDIVQELLNNNAKLHNVVGETLLDIPD